MTDNQNPGERAETEVGRVEATENGSVADGSAGALVRSVTEHTKALCELCVTVLPVDGASVVVRSATDYREMIYATDEVISRLDDLQFVLGEGPCLEAFSQRFPVLEAQLAGPSAATRWPGFAREATQAGAAAVFAFPLQVGAVPFGVLEMYRVADGGLDETELATALLLVDDIVRVVLHDLTHVPPASAETDSNALFGRGEIAQATGMVAVQLEVSIPEALAQLRAAAFARSRSVQSVAEDIVSRRLNLTDVDR